LLLLLLWLWLSGGVMELLLLLLPGRLLLILWWEVPGTLLCMAISQMLSTSFWPGLLLGAKVTRNSSSSSTTTTSGRSSSSSSTTTTTTSGRSSSSCTDPQFSLRKGPLLALLLGRSIVIHGPMLLLFLLLLLLLLLLSIMQVRWGQELPLQLIGPVVFQDSCHQLIGFYNRHSQPPGGSPHSITP
jgi:hypothetical protein